MNSRKLMKRIGAFALSAVLISATAISASAATTDNALNIRYTYTSGDYTFEKVSHVNSPLETNDGVVDYLGDGKVGTYIPGVSEEGNGDRGQSYSYAAASYGDWVYIGTMYGGLGVSSILSHGMNGIDADTAKAAMDVMYNGNLYLGEPDSKYAGGILYKFNVKTGETKILMARSENGKIPTFRGAVQKDGKLYFVGMILDLVNNPGLTQQEISTAIAMQNGFPCVYEIDPANDDALTCIYDCGVKDVTDYRQLVHDSVFTSTRAISFYEDTLVVGGLNTDGVFLAASDHPSDGQDSFKSILTMDDFRTLGVIPAYHRSDVNGGGGIYQALEYNGKLYVVVCTGDLASQSDETGTKSSFGILCGKLRDGGDPTEHDDWSWSVLAGPDGTNAKYPLGLDKERVSAGACTLQVYDDYLYIGDYNDVSSALQNMVLKKNFHTLYTNLQQSINLYRMDADENVEKIVGDPTEAFPESMTGVGSGFGTHMTQYTWQTTVHEGKMYLSTMDETTLLEPIAQFTNGDILNMTEEEWTSQLNYIRVLIEILARGNAVVDSQNAAYFSLADVNDAVSADAETVNVPTTQREAKALIKKAIKAANTHAANVSLQSSLSDLDNAGNANDLKADTSRISLTDAQIDTMVNDLLDGKYTPGSLNNQTAADLFDMNAVMAAMASLVDTRDIDTFQTYYGELVDALDLIEDLLPDNLKPLYKMLLQIATRENLTYLAKCLPYLGTSEAGFDLHTFTNNDDGTVTMDTITSNGFGDRYSHGLRIFAETTDYFVIGTASPFYGSQLWRCKNTVKHPDPSNPDTPGGNTDPSNPDNPGGNTDPSNPDNPGGNTDPSNPDNPGGNTNPSNPDNPGGNTGNNGNAGGNGNAGSTGNGSNNGSAVIPVTTTKPAATAKTDRKSAKTGDTSPIALYGCLIAAAGAAVAITVSRKRKSTDR